MQSEVEPTLTEGSGKPPTKFCACGNKMSGADSHTACIRCLGLEHAKAALAFPPTCEHCARFSNKTRKRRLTKQAKLSTDDPVMGVTDPPLPELAGGSRGLSAPLGTSWGSEVDLTDASQPLELTRPDAIEASLLLSRLACWWGLTKLRAVTPSRGGNLLASALTKTKMMILFPPAPRRLW